MTTVGDLPLLRDLAPNTLVARCVLCRQLRLASDICQTEGDVALCRALCCICNGVESCDHTVAERAGPQCNNIHNNFGTA
jgi:hypothetical protein